jgi:threonine aldolase
MHSVDLRSDTVTKPSEGMRLAIARAVVGDDQYGEDPTVGELQARLARTLGKETGLFMASGTMANQVALKTLTAPGEEVIVGEEAHIVWYEAGAAGANAGVQFAVVGRGGAFTVGDLGRAFKPRGHMVFPPTALVTVENTQSRRGNRVSSRRRHSNLREGSRLAARHLSRRSAPIQCFNGVGSEPGRTCRSLRHGLRFAFKGLGCPIGSILAGSSEQIARATRFRRMFGGALRQAGVLAAAGLYALDHNIVRLGEDHANARMFAERIVGLPGIEVDLKTVQTNIVVFRTVSPAPIATVVVDRAKQRGVLLSAFGPRSVRAATHLDVGAEGCAHAANVLRDLAKSW